MALELTSEELTTDVLVVGSGAAGLMATLEARRSGADVLLVSKGRTGLGNCTAVAGAGLCAALGHADPRDTPAAHRDDTLVGGRYLGDPPLVSIFAEEAPGRMLELERLGVAFKKEGGKFYQARQPGHRYARDCKVYSEGRSELWVPPSYGGKVLTMALKAACEKTGAKFMEKVIIFDLLISGERLAGAVGIRTDSNSIVVFHCGAVILATGGGGEVYLNSAVPPDITGDGYSIALRNGAQLVDMEFVQFYPTVMDEPGVPNWTLPYWSFVEVGGVFRDEQGKDILKAEGFGDPLKVTRDMMAIACARHGRISMDLTKVSSSIWKAGDFKRFRETMARYGVDVTAKPIGVSPMSYYFMGGVRVNEKCETGVPGLFAAGEVTGGIQGANRLGSNALPECIVFGGRAGRFAAEYSRSSVPRRAEEGQIAAKEGLVAALLGKKPSPMGDPAMIRRAIQSTMKENVGVIRSDAGLSLALSDLRDVREKMLSAMYAQTPQQLKVALEDYFLLDTAESIAQAARARRESRGAHYRSDYPAEDDNFKMHVVVVKEGKGDGSCLARLSK